ncbi:MAG: ribonuclease HII [Deltaproteobacteria bacterium]|nr:ribonuclease HII [Deltaproteobacteria bacterium]
MALICGIDEAGRGCLFGPVVVAGCVLDERTSIPKLKDSKELSNKTRVEIFSKILTLAQDFYCLAIGPRRIERYNILGAVLFGFEKCVKKLNADLYVIDGLFKPEVKDKYIICMPRADSTYNACMAASVIAKVMRDSLISNLSDRFQGYSLENHKGYPTRQHRLEILRLGISRLHRKTFKHVNKLSVASIDTNIDEFEASEIV